ncbi:MAG TPA: hypothetical protein VE913_18765 [Longimicrobium sp.]|nr:hypothetical protein [Longimicrobium sp.]
MSSLPARDITTDEWSAVQDFMPPGPPRLRVRGVLVMPTPGYRLSLTRAEPRGINPAVVILDLAIEPPSGMVTQVLTPTPVSYDETSDQRYTQVVIHPDGTTIDVEAVH